MLPEAISFYLHKKRNGHEKRKTDDFPKGSLNILRGLGFFEVGDAVYYKAPKPSYAVRKSTVVEVVTARCHHLAFPRVVYVLANGERLDRWHVYATRSLVEAAIIEDLKSSIAFNKVWLTNLQHDIAHKEAVLKRMENLINWPSK